MIGALYKPAHQQVTAARSDKLGGQGCSSPTLSSGDSVPSLNYLLLLWCVVVNTGSSPSTPTKKHSKPPLVSKAAPLVTSTPQLVSHSVVTTVKAQPTPATRVDDDSSSVQYITTNDH